MHLEDGRQLNEQNARLYMSSSRVMLLSSYKKTGEDILRDVKYVNIMTIYSKRWLKLQA